MKIKRFLRNYFPDKQKFDEFLQGGIDLKEGGMSKTLVKREDLRSLVDSLFEKFSFKASRRALERFMSYFDINQEGKI